MSNALNLQRVARIYERHGRGLPAAASLLLVVAVAWQLAGLAWVLAPLPEAARWQAPPVEPVRPRAATAGTRSIDGLIAARLFGEYRAGAQDGRVEEAPETRLSLTLLGILAGDNRKKSRALIGSSSGEEKPYAIGDPITAGTRLQDILPDRVILNRGGKYETLRLNKEAPSKESLTYQPPPTAGSAETAQALAQIREEILADPTKAANYLRVQPANVNGQLKGYRIYPGRERETFQQLGLRPGDLVTAVNGIQLDDNQKALQLLGDLSQATAVTLTIERGGQSQTLNLSLN
ncbi:type II secretion system protein GspC [Fontimonas sp. SYSU GA230001]|uniref:type II secretion system protein GspC n=1 Tax=Fontimonas sp. SYSU GA230001 TaxID=3142450 RepID=UPI0032B5CA62